MRRFPLYIISATPTCVVLQSMPSIVLGRAGRSQNCVLRACKQENPRAAEQLADGMEQTISNILMIEMGDFLDFNWIN
jgi:hypothetical protein